MRETNPKNGSSFFHHRGTESTKPFLGIFRHEKHEMTRKRSEQSPGFEILSANSAALRETCLVFSNLVSRRGAETRRSDGLPSIHPQGEWLGRRSEVFSLWAQDRNLFLSS